MTLGLNNILLQLTKLQVIFKGLLLFLVLGSGDAWVGGGRIPEEIQVQTT